MKILLIHGIGHQSIKTDVWIPQWESAITNSYPSVEKPAYDYFFYDDIFEQFDYGLTTFTGAAASILKNWVESQFSSSERRMMERSLEARSLQDNIRWYPGMVAQWLKLPKLREAVSKALVAKLEESKPDVIAAHSQGSLITYDTFVPMANPPAWRRGYDELIKDKTVILFGSQVAFPAIKQIYGSYLPNLKAKRWFQLYNEADKVLTREFKNAAYANYTFVPTYFDQPYMFDGKVYEDSSHHSGYSYLSHEKTASEVWSVLANPVEVTAEAATATAREAGLQIFSRMKVPQQRALLVGINDYPDPRMRLRGCVNDVFLMSSVLQERGIDPENIRVVLNERATADAIRERLKWLLEGAGPGDLRVFSFSGHGFQLTDYGIGETVDSRDECLVPYDFDYSRDNAIVDTWFHGLYSQLDYGCNFIGFLDCCHSGGMTRDGAVAIRGINPPDDIRHRELVWNSEEEVWVRRPVQQPEVDSRAQSEAMDPRFAPVLEKTEDGRPVQVTKFGVASELRQLPKRQAEALRKEYGHKGPYIPLLLHACAENEYAYEYRDGATSYGAFTFCMAKQLRRKEDSTFAELVKGTEKVLKDTLLYKQTPQIVGPTAVKNSTVPMKVAGPTGPGTRAAETKASKSRKPAAKSRKAASTSRKRKKPAPSSRKTSRKKK